MKKSLKGFLDPVLREIKKAIRAWQEEEDLPTYVKRIIDKELYSRFERFILSRLGLTDRCGEWIMEDEGKIPDWVQEKIEETFQEWEKKAISLPKISKEETKEWKKFYVEQRDEYIRECLSGLARERGGEITRRVEEHLDQEISEAFKLAMGESDED